VNSHFTDLWVALLCVALAAVALTLGAGVMLAWKQRPIERDPVQDEKIHKRLSQITQSSTAQPKKSA
jgi:hypothetical protein